MRKLYLVTDDDQNPWYVVASDMAKVEVYFKDEMESPVETIKLVEDELIILE